MVGKAARVGSWGRERRPMSLGALCLARPARVFFAATAAAAGFDDAFIYQQISVPLAERSIPFLALMREERWPASGRGRRRQAGSRIEILIYSGGRDVSSRRRRCRVENDP